MPIALKIYTVALGIILFLVVFHAPLSVWLSSLLPQYELLFKSWKEIAMLLLVPLGLYLAVGKKQIHALKNDRLFWLAVGFVLLHLPLALVYPLGVLPMLAGLMIDLRFVVFFMLLYLAVRLVPRARWYYVTSSVVAAGLSLLFSLLQVVLLPRDVLAAIGYGRDTIEPYLTVDNNPALVRINGTFRGPNSLGAYGAMALGMIVSFMNYRRWRSIVWMGFLVSLGIAALLSVWFSYSRSALIATVVTVVMVLLLRYGSKLAASMWVGLCLAALALVFGGFFLLRDTSFVQQVILHDDPQTGAAVNSNEAHVESLQTGVARLVSQPLGAGVGSTGSASLYGDKPFIVENYYLFVAHESGWLGLGLFAGMLGMIFLRLWQRRSDWLATALLASGVGLSVIAIFLPVWADDTVSLVWWGLVAIALASRKSGIIKDHGKHSAK